MFELYERRKSISTEYIPKIQSTNDKKNFYVYIKLYYGLN